MLRAPDNVGGYLGFEFLNFNDVANDYFFSLVDHWSSPFGLVEELNAHTLAQNQHGCNTSSAACTDDIRCHFCQRMSKTMEEEGFVVPRRVDSPQLIDFLIGNFCKIGSKRQLCQL